MISVLADSSEIIKFFNNHHRARALLENYSSTMGQQGKLLVTVVTRWFSQYNSGMSVLKLKYVLVKICDEKPDLMKEISTTGSNVLRIIKNNNFWTKLERAMKSIELPVNLIGKLEADNAPLSLVYESFVKLFETYKDDQFVLPKLRNRWDFIRHEVHSLAYVLTPKFAASAAFLDDKIEVIGIMKEYAKRNDPITAQETFDQMIEFVHDMTEMTCEKRRLVEGLSAAQFWDIYGQNKYPLVFKHAKKINSMSPSSAASERTWSILGFLHNSLRNKLTNDKVEKLAFLYVNGGSLDEEDQTNYIFEHCFPLQGDNFEY